MAQSKHCPYSFYVPENDAQLMRFVKSQSNLSLSVRLLMKAFLSAYKGEMQDVAAADLSDLIRGVRLENIPGLQVQGQAAERQDAPETYGEAGEKDTGTAPSADAVPEEEHGAEPSAGKAIDPAEEAAQAAPATAPAQEQQETHETEAGAPGDAVTQADEAEQVPVPEVTEEPEKPVKTVDSERTAYNESRLPSKKATEDDLMAMMGEGF